MRGTSDEINLFGKFETRDIKGRHAIFLRIHGVLVPALPMSWSLGGNIHSSSWYLLLVFGSFLRLCFYYLLLKCDIHTENWANHKGTEQWIFVTWTSCVTCTQMKIWNLLEFWKTPAPSQSLFPSQDNHDLISDTVYLCLNFIYKWVIQYVYLLSVFFCLILWLIHIIVLILTAGYNSIAWTYHGLFIHFTNERH